MNPSPFSSLTSRQVDILICFAFAGGLFLGTLIGAGDAIQKGISRPTECACGCHKP